jgi:drug/metabolite transporter (DMT)-like permease
LIVKPTINIKGEYFLGLIAGISVVFIWSFWLVVTRSGVSSTLTIYDFAAFRYGLSSLIALPIVLYFKPWQTMSFLRVIVITFLLGPIYILCVFSGFIYAPASHGGIFMNGLMPFFTLIFGFFLFKQKIFLQQMFGAATILFGACLAVYDGLELNFSNTWIGDIFFIIGAIFFSIYVVLSRLWNVTMTQLLFCGSVINAIIYLPIYLIFLPKGLAEAPNEILLLQMIYQGFVPNLIGIFFITYASQKIGSASIAAILSSVPPIGSVLGLLILGELLGLSGWLSLLMITPGILLIVLKRE